MSLPGFRKNAFQIYLLFIIIFSLACSHLLLMLTTSFQLILILLSPWLKIASLPSRLHSLPLLGKDPRALAGSEPGLSAAARLVQPAPASSPTGTLPVGVRNSGLVFPAGDREEEGPVSPNRETQNLATRRIFSLFPGKWLIKDILSAAICVYLGRANPQTHLAPAPTRAGSLNTWDNNESQERAPRPCQLQPPSRGRLLDASWP